MKRAIGLSLVVLVVAAGVWGYFDVQSRGQGQGYRLARVERGPLTAAVSATGNLNAVITVQVGSQVSGQIKEITAFRLRSEEHTSELQSRLHLVCRLLLEKKKNTQI